MKVTTVFTMKHMKELKKKLHGLHALHGVLSCFVVPARSWGLVKLIFKLTFKAILNIKIIIRVLNMLKRERL